MFKKRKKAQPPSPPEALPAPGPNPQVFETLQTLEKAGVQLLVRSGGPEAYTSTVVGLGHEAFFVDTLSPPEGDQRMRPGAAVEIETLYQGITYKLTTKVLGKVQFVDELPAFKLEYPQELPGERHRKSPRVDTSGDASLSFLEPFICDAPVVNLSEGGLAFEYGAELGRLRKGQVIRDILLEIGAQPVITVEGRVVMNLVAELGGLSLPQKYRASLAFQALSESAQEAIQTYLSRLKKVDVTA